MADQRIGWADMILALLATYGVTAAPPTGHRYWRFRATSDCWYLDGDYQASLSSISLFASPDATGVDLALGKTATASSSAGPSYDAEAAVDGLSQTFWHNNSGMLTPAWLMVDLGANADIHSMQIQSKYGSGYEQPATFVLEYSDNGATFTVQNSLATSLTTNLQSFTNL